jgi:hypothetical protein
LTERYLLGELDDAEAAEFEAHYFDCTLCAEDVRQASRMVANFKAVLRDDSRAHVIEIGPDDRFLDLTIQVKPEAAGCLILECEFQSGNAHPTIIDASPIEGSLQLLLRRELLAPGPYILILRDKRSRAEVERCELFVAKLS